MQRGDTIIEVVFAVTVFSMVAVGGLALMNQGAAMAQRSLEIGMVRDQMDAQADALRYMHSAYIANFGQATSNLHIGRCLSFAGV
jgi:type II secretory pathway component PulJ